MLYMKRLVSLITLRLVLINIGVVKYYISLKFNIHPNAGVMMTL